MDRIRFSFRMTFGTQKIQFDDSQGWSIGYLSGTSHSAHG